LPASINTAKQEQSRQSVLILIDARLSSRSSRYTDGALDYDLTIDAAIACVTMVPGHLVPSPLETLEQQFLEGEWIHSPQARIEKLRRLGTIPAAKLLGHGSRLPPSPAMPHRYAGTADHKRQPEQGRGGQDHQRKMRCHRSTPG
jgi:hypothetical protein